jgi:putative ABC transport system permease protein
LPGVTRLARYVDTEASRADGTGVAVAVATLDGIEVARYGYHGRVSPDAMLVSEQMARQGGLARGDRVDIAGERGNVVLEVAHVFRDYGAVRPRIVVDFETAERFAEVTPARRLGIRVANATGSRAVEALAAERGWQLQTREQIRADAILTFERTFAISDALVVVALVVAVIGMGSAFALLELSRTRELFLLDALGVGATRRLRMTVTQVSVLAAHVLLLAIPLGLAIGWILCMWLNPAGFGWSVPFGVHVGAIAMPVAFGFIAALVAGTAPLATRGATHGE